MPNAQQLRAQIEATLAERIPSALTPLPRMARPVASTGVSAVDLLLQGGFPVGAITELVGPECSGRTSLALSFVAGMTRAARVCAWVDVSDALHPESAAAVGVDLSRLLWTRCGISPASAMPRQSPVRSLPISEKTPKLKPGLPQGGSGHPRMEANGLSEAVSDLLGATAARCAEPQHMPRPERPVFTPTVEQPRQIPDQPRKKSPRSASWSRLEQALRVTDLLLQAGGFSCIVLDMGSLQAEYVLRVPLATWFRFRAAAERAQMHVLLLTQHACSKSSAGLVVRMEPDGVLSREGTVFAGLAHRAALERQRFAAAAQNVLPIRKPPQSTHGSQWQSRAAWAGRW